MNTFKNRFPAIAGMTIAAGVALLFTAQPAQAQDNKLMLKPYVGFDLLRNDVSYDSGLGAVFEENFNGANIHIGNRFHENFGVEFGYFRTSEESKNGLNIDLSPISGNPGDILDSTDVRLSGFTLDALGYLPVHKKVELIDTAGLTRIKAEVNYTGTLSGVDGSISGNETEIGFRAGAGAQVHLTERVNLRGLARYQQADFDDIADRAWTYSVGLNYSF